MLTVKSAEVILYVKYLMELVEEELETECHNYALKSLRNFGVNRQNQTIKQL